MWCLVMKFFSERRGHLPLRTRPFHTLIYHFAGLLGFCFFGARTRRPPFQKRHNAPGGRFSNTQTAHGRLDPPGATRGTDCAHAGTTRRGDSTTRGGGNSLCGEGRRETTPWTTRSGESPRPGPTRSGEMPRATTACPTTSPRSLPSESCPNPQCSDQRPGPHT